MASLELGIKLSPVGRREEEIRSRWPFHCPSWRWQRGMERRRIYPAGPRLILAAPQSPLGRGGRGFMLKVNREKCPLASHRRIEIQAAPINVYVAVSRAHSARTFGDRFLPAKM